MPHFNNEYVSKLNRTQTNIYVSKFIDLLFKELSINYHLTMVFPPILTNWKNHFLVNNDMRSIDFDNAFVNEIFKVIDIPDKWLYLYIRQMNLDVNHGIICLNHQINRDVDINKYQMIATPTMTFVVSIQRLDYSQNYLVAQAEKIIEIINNVINQIQIDDFKSNRNLLKFKSLNSNELFSFNKKMLFNDLLIHHTSQQPILLSNFANSKIIQENFPYAKNTFLHNEVNNIYLNYYDLKSVVLDFFNISLQPTYEKIQEMDFEDNQYYLNNLQKSNKNTEWTYIVNINLANILLWVLDKQHYAEIFSGAYGDEFYENSLKDKKDVL